MFESLRSAVVLLAAMSVSTAAVWAERIPYAQTRIEPPSKSWVSAVEEAAPDEPAVKAPARRLLVFALRTGYNHEVIPHVNRVFEILGTKSGAFSVHVSTDIESLAPEALRAFDAIVLNNNCSAGPRRNLFLDALETNPLYAGLTPDERGARASALEQSLIEFVAQGKGLVIIHGALTLLNSSPQFTDMIGARFQYHPPNQEVTVRAADDNHPLVAAFRAAGPFVHRDEPYCFDGSYEKFDFRPLLVIDTERLKDPRGEVSSRIRYVAWIKRHGAGRVFYCSPSHFPESYASPTLLRFLLDGVQYATGDLKCDDSKPEQPAAPPQAGESAKQPSGR